MDKSGVLSAAYDGPIPPAAYAETRFGLGAYDRLARAADAALIEARAGMIRAALAQFRIVQKSRIETGGDHAGRLALALAQYRRAALLCLAPDRV